MPIAILHDYRVRGSFADRPERPVAYLTASDPLASKLENLAGLMLRDATFGAAWTNELVIVCHGTSAGLQLGQGACVDQNSVGLFRALRGLFGIVTIRACNAASAYVPPQYPPGAYNGSQFCARLAQVMSASVMAADRNQGYADQGAAWNAASEIVLAQWVGTVGTWNSAGRLVRISRPEQR